MSSSPQLFDMTKATPIGQPAQGGKPLFDMSKAMPISSTAAATQKAVSPSGQVKMIDPSERQTYQQQGFTMVDPDGSFSLQNIRGEDPLVTEQRRQRVYKALNPQEKSGAIKSEWRTAGQTGLAAAGATAAGVAGASGAPALLEPSTVPVASGVGFGGSAPTTTAGPSLLRQAAELLLKHKLATGLSGGAIGVQALKAAGISPLELLKELIGEGK